MKYWCSIPTLIGLSNLRMPYLDWMAVAHSFAKRDLSEEAPMVTLPIYIPDIYLLTFHPLEAKYAGRNMACG